MRYPGGFQPRPIRRHAPANLLENRRFRANLDLIGLRLLRYQIDLTFAPMSGSRAKQHGAHCASGVAGDEELSRRIEA